MTSLHNPTSSFSQNPLKKTHKTHSCRINSSISTTHLPKRRCDLYDLHKELVPYAEAWAWQKAIVKERKELVEKSEDFADTLIVLQHNPVYTLGTGSSEEYLKFDVKNNNNVPFDLYRTERGGEVTYHGPGQLVMYPIMNLRYHKMDLHWYLRALEAVVIRALSSTFAIEASRVEGLAGVWVGNKKLAALGIKVSQWITCHGLALNVTADLTPFQRIVPCGIKDREVGSIKGVLKAKKENNQDLIDSAYESLVREFCEVFQVDLCHKSVQLGVTDREPLELKTLCKLSQQ